MKAQGSDAKGRGGANARRAFRLEPAGAGSKVLVHTDLALSGSVAQYGRGVGMIQATAAQIMNQFANNLKAQLAQQPRGRYRSRRPSGSRSDDARSSAADVRPIATAAGRQADLRLLADGQGAVGHLDRATVQRHAESFAD